MSAEHDIVATLNRFADHVNRGEITDALACFADDPSIVEDLAPFHWRGVSAGGAWLAAMAENAEREGLSRIEMRFGTPNRVMQANGRGYAVLPGDLTYTPVDGAPTHVQGHATFVVQRIGPDWRIETLNWSWEREGPA